MCIHKYNVSMSQCVGAISIDAISESLGLNLCFFLYLCPHAGTQRLPSHTHTHTHRHTHTHTHTHTRTHTHRSTSETHLFVWHLLSLIASVDRPDLRRYLYRALEHWSQTGKLTSRLVKDVCTHTTGDKEHAEVCERVWVCTCVMCGCEGVCLLYTFRHLCSCLTGSVDVVGRDI